MSDINAIDSASFARVMRVNREIGGASRPSVAVNVSRVDVHQD
jgi:hypothetical protein